MAKSCFKVSTTPLLTVIPVELKLEIAHALLQQNIQQSFIENKDSEGKDLPEGIDLFESGDLKDETDINVDGYRFEVDYAEYVDRRFHFAGLSEESMQAVEPTLQKLFDEAGDTLIATEEE